MASMAFIPYPCLVADVGGTNARFALAESRNAPLSDTIRLPTGQHSDFTATVEEALRLGGFGQPRSLLLAVAGAVDGKAVTLTNAKTLEGLIALDGPRLAERLGLQQGLMLNDFEALSLSLPFLRTEDLQPVGGGLAVHDAPQIVIGPGTGLGVGAVIRNGGRLMALASEGGHAGIGPETAADCALWSLLAHDARDQKLPGDSRLSGDDLLSGRGLTRLYHGFARLAGCPGGKLDDTPAAITARALAGTDSFAVQTVEQFFTLLGRFTGDMALTFGARGGVYIGGGIVPRLSGALHAGPFRGQFEAKPLHRSYLAQIPVWLITAPEPALIGLAELARSPEDFAFDFAGRFWR
jgi:glucokinase